VDEHHDRFHRELASQPGLSSTGRRHIHIDGELLAGVDVHRDLSHQAVRSTAVVQLKTIKGVKMELNEQLLQDYREMSDDFSKAKAQRIYLEEFKKSQLAIAMKDAETKGFKTSAAQEREALAAPEYQQLLQGLRTAIETEERVRYNMRRIEMEIEIWRTLRADERMERKAYGA